MHVFEGEEFDHLTLRESFMRRFGKESFGLCRKYESTCLKLAQVKNHCVFNLRCKKSGLIPRGLRVIPPVRTQHGFALAERVSHAFVREALQVEERTKRELF